VTEQRPERDVRCCPECGARGVLPLDQPHTPDGSIRDPIMTCPVCVRDFRAVGARWLGAFPVPQDDAELEAVANEMERRLGGTRED
jgi:hypothetical protein